MGGLLYKDFVAVHGKREVWFLVFFTTAFVVLRLLFPGEGSVKALYVTDDDGKIINMADLVFATAVWTYLIISMYRINHWVSECVGLDEGSRVRGFISAMPLGSNTYVISKYVFIGIATYVLLSVFIIWQVVCDAFMLEGRARDFLYISNALMIPFYSVMLLTAAFELPMFLFMGRARSMTVKTVFWLALAMIAIWYLLFGDLELIRRLDFDAIVKWMEAHEFTIILLNILSPVIVLAVYYASCSAACRLYERREIGDD